MLQIKDKQLHFIIGIGRSGTTILSKLLNQYTDINCMPEANFLLFFLHKYKSKHNFTTSEINLIFEQINIYSLSHPFVGWDFDINNAKNNIHTLIKTKGQITYQELCIELYNNFINHSFNKKNATCIIDKNPSYTIFINQIHKTFKTSKFIYIVRDHRANILSRKQSIYLKSPNIAFNAMRWKLFNKIAYGFSRKFQDKILLVKYENLIINNEQEMQKIITFLNIEPNKEQLDGTPIDYKKYIISEKYKDRFDKKYSDLNKTLNPTRIEVWKDKLSATEILLADSICHSISVKLGYLPVYHLKRIHTFMIKLKAFLPIINGYLDVYKDRLIYYLPINLKLSRLKQRYLKLGFKSYPELL